MSLEPPILAVRDLSVRFGALVAVNTLNFVAQRGHITSVIGPNGAGKSTLFNLISGALKPASGHVLFEGIDVTGRSPEAMLAIGVGRSFQITNLFFDLSVYENLRLAAQVHEPSANLMRPVRRSRLACGKVELLLERFGLADKALELAGYLSHGEQRRLEIAVTLASEPKLLMLDEPTQGMSHADTAETAELIRSLAGERSILLIEHDIDLVMTLSDHVVVMHQGALLAEGTPEAVRAHPGVRDAYLGHG